MIGPVNRSVEVDNRGELSMSFICPRCGAESHHPKDEEHGYCAACHDFTGTPVPREFLSTAALDRLYDDSKCDNTIIVGSDIRQLVGEIRYHRRLFRVDTALARRLGDSIARDSDVLRQLTDWQRAYPLDVFPEPDFAKAAELLKAGGQTLDAISASNIRHALKRVLEIIQASNNPPPPQ
jgi:ribosomal protein L37E